MYFHNRCIKTIYFLYHIYNNIYFIINIHIHKYIIILIHTSYLFIIKIYTIKPICNYYFIFFYDYYLITIQDFNSRNSKK